MMLTEYWIFMLVWCFILGKLNALPVMYWKNLLKIYTWNTKNIHHNYKLNFSANTRFLKMGLLKHIYVKEGNHFPRNQKSESKTENILDNIQQKCFFKSFL